MDSREPYDTMSRHLGSPLGIINETDFHRAAVLIPFFIHHGELAVLFEKRADNIRQGGEVSFPGGGIEEHDSDSRDTALRETREELGIEEDRISYDGFLGTFLGALGVMIDAHLGFLDIDDPDSLLFNRAEVAELFPLPFSFFLENAPRQYSLDVTIKSVRRTPEGNEKVLFPARDLGLPRRYHSTWNVRPHHVYVYPTQPHVLWGITARIMQTLTDWYRTLA